MLILRVLGTLNRHDLPFQVSSMQMGGERSYGHVHPQQAHPEVLFC
jgi:hypothetical protein